MEGTTSPVSLRSPPMRYHYSRPPPPFRFIGFLDKKADEVSTAPIVELDERDVLWPSDPPSTVGGEGEGAEIISVRRPFPRDRLGLTASLAEGGAGPPTEDPDLAAGEIGRLLRQSAPMNVPICPLNGSAQQRADLRLGHWMDEEEQVQNEERGNQEERVPPHVIVARSHVMSFSVFEGVGRTLKGRDLRRVRDAVFRKTGFLD